MPNRCVKDDSIRILLDRREEIRNEINKLEAEYGALGDILTRVYNYEKEKKEAGRNERAGEEK